MTLKLGLLRNKNKQCESEYCEGLKPHSHSENQLPNKSLDRLLRPQLSNELLHRENEFKRIYSSTYQRCRQITSKAHEHRNRFKLGRPIKTGQKVLLENHAADLTKSQKLKQLRIGPFTVTKQITNTTYEIRDDANPENVKITHRNHLIEYFPKEERLPPLIAKYAPIETDSDFYKHLVKTQIDKYNNGEERHSLDMMPFIITPLQNDPPIQNQKENIEFSPKADSGIQSPESTTLQSPQAISNYENRMLFPLPELQTPILPMTPMPRRTPNLALYPSPIHDYQQSTSSSNPQKKNKIIEFATKAKEKYQRNTPTSSLRKLERKGYKD